MSSDCPICESIFVPSLKDVVFGVLSNTFLVNVSQKEMRDPLLILVVADGLSGVERRQSGAQGHSTALVRQNRGLVSNLDGRHGENAILALSGGHAGTLNFEVERALGDGFVAVKLQNDVRGESYSVPLEHDLCLSVRGGDGEDGGVGGDGQNGSTGYSGADATRSSEATVSRPHLIPLQFLTKVFAAWRPWWPWWRVSFVHLRSTITICLNKMSVRAVERWERRPGVCQGE